MKTLLAILLLATATLAHAQTTTTCCTCPSTSTSSTSSTTSTLSSTTSTSTTSTTSTSIVASNPNKPLSFMLTALSCSQVQLSWTAPAVTTYPIAGYDVFRWNGAAFVSMLPANTTTPGPTYTDTGRTQSTTWYYTVETVDTHGLRSGQAAWKSVITPSCTATTTSSSTIVTTSSSTTSTSVTSTTSTSTGGTTTSSSTSSSSSSTSTSVTSTTSTTMAGGLGTFRWNRQIIGANAASSSQTGGIALDSGGNTISGGAANGTVDFGQGNVSLVNALFLAKYTTTGSVTWVKTAGGGGSNQAGVRSVKTDANNYVITTGYLIGTLNLGGGNLTSAGSGDIFLAKYDSTGTLLWGNRYGGANNDSPYSVTTDSSNNILLTGKIGSAVDFGGGALAGNAAGTTFLAKFDPNGNHIWSRICTSGGSANTSSIATASNGDVYLGATYNVNIDCGLGTVSSFGGSGDAYLGKFNSSGTPQWNLHGGGTGSDGFYSVAVDQSSGKVAATGIMAATANFGGANLVGASLTDIIVAQYDSAGVHQWSKQYGDGATNCGADAGQGITVDSSSNIAVTGLHTCGANFGCGILVPVGGNTPEVFTAKLNSAGTCIWSHTAGGPGVGDGGFFIATTPGGIVSTEAKVDGRFGGTHDFGGGNLTVQLVDTVTIQYNP